MTREGKIAIAIMQIIRFRALPEVTEAEVEAMNDRFQQEVAPKLPGLKRREAGVTPDGEWVLVLHYDSADQARAAMGVDKTDVSGKLMAMMDKPTIKIDLVDVRSA
jgi:hypothetical protein